MTPELEALTERLAEVEKQIAHLAALVTEQSDIDRTVVARSFVVRDAQGKRRMELGMMVPPGEKEARPCLSLFDTNETVQALLMQTEEFVSLQLHSPKGKTELDVWVNENGSTIELKDASGKRSGFVTVAEAGPYVGLCSPDGKPRLGLRVTPQGNSTLFLMDGNETARLILGLSTAGEPYVEFFDGNGKERLRLDTISVESGIPRLLMREPNGRPTVVMQAVEDSPSVCLFDPKNPDGNTSVQVVMDSKGPSLLCVKDGKVLWSAPYPSEKAPPHSSTKG